MTTEMTTKNKVEVVFSVVHFLLIDFCVSRRVRNVSMTRYKADKFNANYLNKF